MGSHSSTGVGGEDVRHDGDFTVRREPANSSGTSGPRLYYRFIVTRNYYEDEWKGITGPFKPDIADARNKATEAFKNSLIGDEANNSEHKELPTIPKGQYFGKRP